MVFMMSLLDSPAFSKQELSHSNGTTLNCKETFGDTQLAEKVGLSTIRVLLVCSYYFQSLKSIVGDNGKGCSSEDTYCFRAITNKD